MGDQASCRRPRIGRNPGNAPGWLNAWRAPSRAVGPQCAHGVVREAIVHGLGQVRPLLADRSERLKASTLQRRLATIAEAHRASGHESPNRHARVRLVWQGIRREKGVAQALALALAEPLAQHRRLDFAAGLDEHEWSSSR